MFARCAPDPFVGRSMTGTLLQQPNHTHDKMRAHLHTPGIIAKLVKVFAVILLVALPYLNSAASPRSDPQMRALKQRHKQERAALKQQQRAMQRVLAQHEQTAESKRRFEHDMKIQRRMLWERQKDETRRLKSARKAPKYRPATPQR